MTSEPRHYKSGPIIPKRTSGHSAPLSFAQLQMWVMDQMSPGNPAYGMPNAFRLTGPLDLAALEHSFNELIKRHELLRTTFAVVDGEPQQSIHPECRIKIRTLHLDHLPSADRERRLHILASEEASSGFDLGRLPLIRVLLFKLSDCDHVLLVNMHHILGDGMSVRLMLSELNTHYELFRGARHVDLPDLPIQYGDFAAWQRDTIASKDHAREIAFWRQQLQGDLPTLELPTDLPRPPLQSFKGSNAFFEIPTALAQALAALGAREGCTLFTTLLAGFEVLLHRYSNATSLVIGTPLAMRVPADVQPLIGNFLNMIPLRCDLSGDPSFVQVLRRTKTTTLRAFSKAALPFEKIVENVKFRRDPSRSPIFQAMVEILPAVPSRLGDLHVENFYFDLRFAQFDLSLHAIEETHGYICRFEYCTDLFHADTMQRMSANFLQLLSSVVANPNQRIATIPILAESEKRQVLVDWNRTSRAYTDDKCLHHLFETIAATNPGRVAIECGGRTLTYNELNTRANRLANHLLASKINAEGPIGVCLERSPDLVIGLLGILKAGAAYVPLDPVFPPERLAYMIEDAGVSTVVTQSNLQSILRSRARTVICLDLDSAAIETNSALDPRVPSHPCDLAYTIYTSGSSGQPKGVMIEHRSLVNCLASMQNEPGFDATDAIVAVTTISFDIAALELFLPLISGGRLVIAAKEETVDGFLLAKLIQQSQATTLQATPATWRLLLDAGWRPTPEFKMLCGGEALPRELANQLLEHAGQLWNMYGPTETTIWSAVHKVRPATGPVPIGPPIANTQFYVVDEELQPVPVGVPGELLIGGDGLSRGYLNRPDLTSERFVTTRLSGSEATVYRTGDLVRFRPEGWIEFLGRRDFQVKIRGYRIELEEIENVLAQHELVKDAVVLAWENPLGDKHLVAYYIPRTGTKPRHADLRQHLRAKLPEYMCPSYFMELPAFPLTPNGKVDRKAFRDPDVSTLESRANQAGPQSSLERRLLGIWKEILNRTVGLDDNFFDLGGHSLLAARLFVLIRKKLGVELPLATLFQAPTVRALANKIKQTGRLSDWNSLVPIQIRGNKPPLFLVHGAEGNVLLYRNLSQYLGKDQPVYGLQSQGLQGGSSFEASLERIAARYLQEIRSVQPVGPYFVGGYCLGGTIAFEIARQLKLAGESVAVLALIETYNVKTRPPVSLPLSLLHKVQNLYFQTRNLLISQSRLQFFIEKLQIEWTRLRIYAETNWTKLVNRFRSTPGVGFQHLQVRDANHQAQAAYSPGLYHGKIILFRPKIHFLGFNDPCFGWNALATEGVQVIELPNFPRGSLNQPFVKDLVDALKGEIERALQEPAHNNPRHIVPTT